MYQIGWFSTGRDKAARDLLAVVQNKINQGEIEAEIAFVFSDREPGESRESDLFFDLVQEYHISLIYFSYRNFKAINDSNLTNKSGTLPPWRLDYDREVMDRLADFQPDICVLAGYMLIVGEEMCHRCNMINLHPAAPGGPKGTWQEVIWQLIEKQAKETGVMMHLVTPELDMGPPVTYCTFPIRGRPFDRYWQEIEGQSIKELIKNQGENNRLFHAIRECGLMREFPLITATIKAFAQGKVKISAGKIFNLAGNSIMGYNLTDEIDKSIKEV